MFKCLKKIFGGNENKEEKTMSNPVKKLYLDVEDRKIGGVCSGLAAYFDIDVTLIRIIFLALLIGGGFGFWLYLIFWIVAPKAMTKATATASKTCNQSCNSGNICVCS